MDEQKLRDILSKNLRKYRNYSKLSQAELAEKLGQWAKSVDDG